MKACLVTAVLLTVAHSAIGQTTRECLANKDCPSNRLCEDWKCVDACRDDICDPNSDCTVSNHIPICACKPGFSGPLSGGSSSNEAGNKKFYLHSKSRMDWHSAHYYCLSQGMRLATLESQEEHNRVVTMIKSLGPITPRARWWIGATDLQKKGEFKWFSTGKPLKYRNFPEGQPDNADWQGWSEHCVGLFPDWDYRWNDFMCEQSQHFVCEYFE